ncbi:MAG: DUF2795 domain-containing protein [Sphingomonas sp.]
MTSGMGGHSPSNLAHYLNGVDFPANRDDLREQAEDNGAEDEVLEVIEMMPDEDFESMADVMVAYGEAAAQARGEGDDD